MTRARWRTLLYLLMTAALLFAVRPLRSRYEPETLFLHADKLVHVSFFAVLWFIARRAGHAAGWPLALGLLAYGVGIEVAQSLAPTMRSASLSDLAFDALGLALAWALGSGLARVSRQPEKDRR
jgi:VanZ family protein